MIDLWWAEAERNQVLPITNMPGLHGDRRHRRNHYEYYAGISSLPDAVAPNLRNRSWQMTADIDNTNGDAAGVIANHGGAAGGYAIYVKDGRLCYVDNFLGTETTIVRGGRWRCPEARVTVKCTFASTGTFGGGGEVELFHDDTPVGGGNVPRTVPISFGMSGFEVGYQRGPVDHLRLRRAVPVHGRAARQGDVRRRGPSEARCGGARAHRERDPAARPPAFGSRNRQS